MEENLTHSEKLNLAKNILEFIIISCPNVGSKLDPLVDAGIVSIRDQEILVSPNFPDHPIGKAFIKSFVRSFIEKKESIKLWAKDLGLEREELMDGFAKYMGGKDNLYSYTKAVEEKENPAERQGKTDTETITTNELIIRLVSGGKPLAITQDLLDNVVLILYFNQHTRCSADAKVSTETLGVYKDLPATVNPDTLREYLDKTISSKIFIECVVSNDQRNKMISEAGFTQTVPLTEGKVLSLPDEDDEHSYRMVPNPAYNL